MTALNKQMSTQALQIMAEEPAPHPAFMVVPLEPPTPASTPANMVNLPAGVADFDRSEIRHHNGQRDALSAREGELLGYLTAHAGRPVSRDEILQQVWGLDPRRLITRTIDMHIANLRDKLRDDPGDPKILFTVRGKGYMFAPKNPH
jgi:DNA-binding response OmpR family regulator